MGFDSSSGWLLTLSPQGWILDVYSRLPFFSEAFLLHSFHLSGKNRHKSRKAKCIVNIYLVNILLVPYNKIPLICNPAGRMFT